MAHRGTHYLPGADGPQAPALEETGIPGTPDERLWPIASDAQVVVRDKQWIVRSTHQTPSDGLLVPCIGTSTLAKDTPRPPRSDGHPSRGLRVLQGDTLAVARPAGGVRMDPTELIGAALQTAATGAVAGRSPPPWEIRRRRCAAVRGRFDASPRRSRVVRWRWRTPPPAYTAKGATWCAVGGGRRRGRRGGSRVRAAVG